MLHGLKLASRPIIPRANQTRTVALGPPVSLASSCACHWISDLWGQHVRPAPFFARETRASSTPGALPGFGCYRLRSDLGRP
jgi:hypothetical protein